jgi:hypothetical protein
MTSIDEMTEMTGMTGLKNASKLKTILFYNSYFNMPDYQGTMTYNSLCP